jgi:uncharacterized protein
MKKYLKFISILLLIITILISVSCKSTKSEISSVNEIEESLFLTYTGDEFPKPAGYVNDYEDLIDKNYEDKILSEIKEVKEDTEAEIVIVIIKSLEGKGIDDYTLELYNTWKISRYGIVLLISIDEKELHITTGYDMENVITDDIAKGIINDVIIPEFRESNYSEGIYQGVKKISEYVLAYGPYISESSKE